MSDFKFTQEQIAKIQRGWREGRFKAHNLNLKDSTEVLRKWEQLGIVKKTSAIWYEINRARFIQIQRDHKQETLF